MRDSDLTDIPIQNSKHQIQIHKEKKIELFDLIFHFNLYL